jgi:Domain of unknown function (DUF4115)
MATQAVDRGNTTCSSCGATGLPTAGSCLVCGALLGPEPDAARDRCRMMWWRGYTRSTFYVTLPGGTLLESAPFAWRGAAAPPENQAVRSAYETLVERLLAGGWEREGQGAIWYETHFVRRVPGMATARIAHEEVSAEQEPEPEPEPKTPRRAPSRRVRSARGPKRELTLGAFACVILAATFVVMGAAHGGANRAAKPLPAAAPKVNHDGARAPKAPAARAQLVDVRIEAQQDGSWLEVRRGSSSGRVLYSGMLLPGTQLHFRAPRVWARLGAAGNLSIVANGRPVSVHGTYDKVFVPPAKK